MKALIIDDHDVIASGLSLVLQEHCGVSEIATARSAERARAALAQPDYDLVLLDMNLPDGHGVDLVADIKSRCENAKLVVVSGNLNAPLLSRLQALAVDGIYDKGDSSTALAAVVNAALQGTAGEVSGSVADVAARFEDVGLSHRQLQVLSFLAEGLTNKEIAYRQSLSQATVAFHVAVLKKKLGCDTSREILIKARELGILS